MVYEAIASLLHESGNEQYQQVHAPTAKTQWNPDWTGRLYTLHIQTPRANKKQPPTWKHTAQNVGGYRTPPQTRSYRNNAERPSP